MRVMCYCSAAVGNSSSSSLNSPQAKEVVLSALQAAGKEAGLKVRSFCTLLGLAAGVSGLHGLHTICPAMLA